MTAGSKGSASRPLRRSSRRQIVVAVGQADDRDARIQIEVVLRAAVRDRREERGCPGGAKRRSFMSTTKSVANGANTPGSAGVPFWMSCEVAEHRVGELAAGARQLRVLAGRVLGSRLGRLRQPVATGLGGADVLLTHQSDVTLRAVRIDPAIHELVHPVDVLAGEQIVAVEHLRVAAVGDEVGQRGRVLGIRDVVEARHDDRLVVVGLGIARGRAVVGDLRAVRVAVDVVERRRGGAHANRHLVLRRLDHRARHRLRDSARRSGYRTRPGTPRRPRTGSSSRARCGCGSRRSPCWRT